MIVYLFYLLFIYVVQLVSEIHVVVYLSILYLCSSGEVDPTGHLNSCYSSYGLLSLFSLCLYLAEGQSSGAPLNNRRYTNVFLDDIKICLVQILCLQTQRVHFSVTANIRRCNLFETLSDQQACSSF